MNRPLPSLLLSAAALAALTAAARADPVGVPDARAGYTIDNFLAERAALITANAPDLTGRLDRDGPFGAAGLSGLAATGDPAQFTVDVATSLARLARTAGQEPPPVKAAAEQLEAYGPLDSRLHVPSAAASAGPSSPLDVWGGGKWNHDGGTDFGSTDIGADYQLDHDLLVGLAGQLDWTAIDDPAAGASAEGAGWMVGPYIERRLRPGLVFDGHAGWGLSDNRVGLAGSDASYDTTRWFANAVLKGDSAAGAWHFNPQLAALYYAGGQESPDGLAPTAAAPTVALGQVAFGPSMSYAVDTGWATLQPSLAVSGVWDFAKAQTIDLDSGVAADGQADVHARAEVQLPFSFTNGTSLTAKGYIDGIGDAGARPYGATMQLHVPLG